MSYTLALVTRDNAKGVPHSSATWAVFLFSIGSCIALFGFLFSQSGIFVKDYLKKFRIKAGFSMSDSSPLVPAKDSSISVNSNNTNSSTSENYQCQVCGCTHTKQLCSDCGTITDTEVDVEYFTHWRWYFASFMFEMFVVFFVLITTALCSIKRNNMFGLFK